MRTVLSILRWRLDKAEAYDSSSEHSSTARWEALASGENHLHYSPLSTERSSSKRRKQAPATQNTQKERNKTPDAHPNRLPLPTPYSQNTTDKNGESQQQQHRTPNPPKSNDAPTHYSSSPNKNPTQISPSRVAGTVPKYPIFTTFCPTRAHQCSPAALLTSSARNLTSSASDVAETSMRGKYSTPCNDPIHAENFFADGMGARRERSQTRRRILE